MADFFEDFESHADWTFGTSGSGDFLIENQGTAPFEMPSYDGLSHARVRIDGSAAWGAAVFDADDPNVAATTYWMSYAFRILSWESVDSLTAKTLTLPGFINLNDDPKKGATGASGVLWYPPKLIADDIHYGKISTPGMTSGDRVSLTGGHWHTLRFGVELNGASSHETLYLNDALVWDEDIDWTAGGAPYTGGIAGVFVGVYGTEFGGFLQVHSFIDSLSYSAAGDPGEPPGGGTSGFTETFDVDVSAWDFGSGPTDHLEIATTSPDPFEGVGRGTAIYDNNGDWAAARFDVNLGGQSSDTTYWLAYAFYMPTWAEIEDFQGGGDKFFLPGFITRYFDPTEGLTTNNDTAWLMPYLAADSSTTGKIFHAGEQYGTGLPGVSLVGENEWHTLRLGLRVDGATSHETIYLDDVLIFDEDIDYDAIGGLDFMYDGVAGVVIASQGFGDIAVSLPVDAMTYSALADPGEPAESETVICGQGVTVRVYIDDTEVTNVCTSGSWTPRLNRPAQATVTIPMEESVGDAGSRLRIYFVDGATQTLKFHGKILNIETTADKDQGYTQYNAQDPMELWPFRPVRDDGADFSKPDIITDKVYGPSILEAMLINTIDSTGRTNTEGETGGPPPTDAEGPIFLDMNASTFAAPDMNTAELTGAPVDWPMTIGEMFSLIVSTGRLDAVITPIEEDVDGNLGVIDAYHGDYGTNRTATVIFQYGMGAYNVAALRWNRDMTQMVNKYWLYGGPRIQSVTDPAGDQHWCFNITGFSTLPSPPGGQSVDENNDPVGPPWTNNELGEKIFNSRIDHGVRMKVDIFDAYDEDCIPGFGTPGKDLYKYQWQVFSWFSAEPREIIHITPVPDYYVGCFHIGDLITVQASTAVRGGFSGAQRVYEYTVSWEGTPSVLTLSELLVSSDAEGSAG